MASDVEKRKGGGLRLVDGVVLVAVGVVGVIVAFWLLGAVAGFLWGLVKLVIIVALVAGVLCLLLRRAPLVAPADAGSAGRRPSVGTLATRWSTVIGKVPLDLRKSGAVLPTSSSSMVSPGAKV